VQQVQRIQRVLLNKLLEQAGQLEQLALERQELLDSRVQLAQVAAQQEPQEPLVKAQQVLRDYLESTELRVLLVFAELLEAQEPQVSKVLRDYKALLVSVHLELRELRDSKAQSAHKVLLEALALADQQD
jgi:hypothetical protein